MKGMTFIDLTAFFQQNTRTVARQLLGKHISYRGTGAWIVETEAYVGKHDLAAHAHSGKTHRNRALFMSPGTIYMFSIFGHNALNFSTHHPGEGVLIRAVEPANGVKLMKDHRQTAGINLTNGPGKLAQAMKLPMSLNTQMVNQQAFQLTLNPHRCRTPHQIQAAPRIGIPNKGKWTTAPLRYFVASNPYVSKIRKRAMNRKTHGWKTILH